MDYTILEYTVDNSWLDPTFSRRHIRRECGGDERLYQAHLAIDGDKIVKNHTRFTDEQIRKITNNLKNLDRINKNYYLLIQ